MLCSGSDDGIARVWQLGGDSGIGQPMQHGAAVRAMAARPDGKAIATVDRRRRRLAVGRLDDALESRTPQGHGAGSQFELAFNPAGTVLVTAAADGTMRLWNGATLEPIGPVIKMTGVGQVPSRSARTAASLAAGDQTGRLGLLGRADRDVRSGRWPRSQQSRDGPGL